jgi:uracil-DNA glycosylase
MIVNLEEVHSQIRTCKRCRLWESSRNAVAGEGNPNAKIMLVGQNPGKKEDETGRPFVGRSGIYLDKVLQKNRLERESFFITSIVKHASPGNRPPKPDEIKACVPYLEEQIKLIKPKIIVLMGKIAGKLSRQPDIEYIETYHPAAAMRFSKVRKKFEIDFTTLAAKVKQFP